jgi:hypothetical protein
MTKKRSIISYENLSIEQKKGILRAYPDGYSNHLSEIKTPTGEIFNTLIWETDETIYLVKFPKRKALTADDDDDDDDDLDDELEGIEDADDDEEADDED